MYANWPWKFLSQNNLVLITSMRRRNIWVKKGFFNHFPNVSVASRKETAFPLLSWVHVICSDISSFTLLSVHVISCMQLPVDDAISLQLSLKISNMLFFPTVKLSFKLSKMHQMQILPTKKSRPVK